MERNQKMPFSAFSSESSDIFYCAFDLSCQLCLFLSFHHPCCSNLPPIPLTSLSFVFVVCECGFKKKNILFCFIFYFIYYYLFVNFTVRASYFSTNTHEKVMLSCWLSHNIFAGIITF